VYFVVKICNISLVFLTYVNVSFLGFMLQHLGDGNCIRFNPCQSRRGKKERKAMARAAKEWKEETRWMNRELRSDEKERKEN
jgi:hypothetical protein